MSRAPEADAGDGFLGRWARRKSQARRGDASTPDGPGEAGTVSRAARTAAPAATDAARPPSAGPADDPPAAPAAVATREPAVAGNPDAAGAVDARPIPSVDSLDEHSDFSRFLAPDVSADLQRLALRKLFRLPGLVVRDGLDDYDDDYTAFEPLGDIVTADMRHQMELAEAARQGDEAAGTMGPGVDPALDETAGADAEPVDAAAPATEGRADAAGVAAAEAAAVDDAAATAGTTHGAREGADRPPAAGHGDVSATPAPVPAPVPARPRLAGKLSPLERDAG